MLEKLVLVLVKPAGIRLPRFRLQDSVLALDALFDSHRTQNGLLVGARLVVFLLLLPLLPVLRRILYLAYCTFSRANVLEDRPRVLPRRRAL